MRAQCVRLTGSKRTMTTVSHSTLRFFCSYICTFFASPVDYVSPLLTGRRRHSRNEGAQSPVEWAAYSPAEKEAAAAPVRTPDAARSESVSPALSEQSSAPALTSSTTPPRSPSNASPSSPQRSPAARSAAAVPTPNQVMLDTARGGEMEIECDSGRR